MRDTKRRFAAAVTAVTLASASGVATAAACQGRGDDGGTYPTDTSGSYPSDTATTTTTASGQASASGTKAKKKKAKKKARKAVTRAS